MQSKEYQSKLLKEHGKDKHGVYFRIKGYLTYIKLKKQTSRATGVYPEFAENSHYPRSYLRKMGNKLLIMPITEKI